VYFNNDILFWMTVNEVKNKRSTMVVVAINQANTRLVGARHSVFPHVHTSINATAWCHSMAWRWGKDVWLGAVGGCHVKVGGFTKPSHI